MNKDKSHLLSRLLTLCYVALLAVCAASCDVHEFPAKSVQSDAHEVKLHLDFSTAMPLYQEVTYGRAAEPETFDMYYHVEAYRMDDDGNYSTTPDVVVKFVSEDLEYQNQTITMSLGSGSYRLHVWASYVEDNEYDRYFAVESLQEIAITDTKSRTGNTDMADAFRSIHSIDVHAQSREFTVPMTRPVAKFELRAKDVQEFVANTSNTSRAAKDLIDGKYTATVRYIGYVPCLYSLAVDNTVDSRTNMSFTGALTLDGDNEAVVGFDYLFINPNGGAVSLVVDIYDANGTRVAGTSSFDVPLKQGHLTVVTGNFLSSESNGLGINSEFIGPDYNIRL